MQSAMIVFIFTLVLCLFLVIEGHGLASVLLAYFVGLTMGVVLGLALDWCWQRVEDYSQRRK